MSKYRRCPNCFKIVMFWHNHCSRCGNNLECGTIVSDRYLQKRKNKLNKKFGIK